MGQSDALMAGHHEISAHDEEELPTPNGALWSQIVIVTGFPITYFWTRLWSYMRNGFVRFYPQVPFYYYTTNAMHTRAHVYLPLPPSRFVTLNRNCTHSSHEIGLYLAGCFSSKQLESRPHVSLKLKPKNISPCWRYVGRKPYPR